MRRSWGQYLEEAELIVTEYLGRPGHNQTASLSSRPRSLRSGRSAPLGGRSTTGHVHLSRVLFTRQPLLHVVTACREVTMLGLALVCPPCSMGIDFCVSNRAWN